MTYVPRTLEPVLRRALAEFPATVLTGPRQSGKTTLLRHLLGESHGYVSLEAPDVRALALDDPRGFLAHHGEPLVLDEIQHAPELLPYLKERIDADRARRGRFVLTGSQNLLLLQRVTETLAGRAAILRLLPFSRAEAAGEPQRAPAWEDTARAAERTPSPGATGRALWDSLVRGGYPELVTEPQRDVALWYASYVQTYLERDVRGLRQVGDLAQFQSFLRALAARSAQLLNLTELARDLGVAVNTAKAWLSVLEATHQVLLLRPFHANLTKRLVKAPKPYFTDTGLLCHLAGVRDADAAAHGPLAGAIFETAVVSEVLKQHLHRGLEPRLHFWRTATGVEVDLLVEHGPRLVPIEAKASATPRPRWSETIDLLAADLGDRLAPGFVVHAGDAHAPLGPRAGAVGLGSL